MKHVTSEKYFPAARQGGAVLFVALVFLVLITLLALTAASTSILQERMTGGLRNGQLALMGSESTARSVEWLIWNKSNNAVSNKLHCGATGGDDFCYQANNNSGTYGMNSKVVTFRNLQGWPSTTGNGATSYATTMTGLSGDQQVASLAQQPQYLIEDLGLLLPPGSPNSGNGGGRLNAGSNGTDSTAVHSYRITARATGGNGGSVAAMESYFVGQPPSN